MSLHWNDRYQTDRQPDRVLRKMTAGDIPGAVALIQAVGWANSAADIERLLHWSPEGCFCCEELDRGIVGTVTTTAYGTDLAWIGMMIVAPDRQHQGIGGQLMRAALDHLITNEVARIMLDASEAGRPLYERMGFRKVCKIERWEGRASTYLGQRARRMRPDELDAVIAMDATMFGVAREHILRRFYEEFPKLAWIDETQGRIEGFLLGHRLPNSLHLGPWMSWSSASAERLLRTAFEQLQGEHITMNISDQNGRGLLIARNHNLKRIRHCTRMIYGDAQPLTGEPLAELAVATLATG